MQDYLRESSERLAIDLLLENKKLLCLQIISCNIFAVSLQIWSKCTRLFSLKMKKKKVVSFLMNMNTLKCPVFRNKIVYGNMSRF